jgi:hypothetical protein
MERTSGRRNREDHENRRPAGQRRNTGLRECGPSTRSVAVEFPRAVRPVVSEVISKIAGRAESGFHENSEHKKVREISCSGSNGDLFRAALLDGPLN